MTVKATARDGSTSARGEARPGTGSGSPNVMGATRWQGVRSIAPRWVPWRRSCSEHPQRSGSYCQQLVVDARGDEAGAQKVTRLMTHTRRCATIRRWALGRGRQAVPPLNTHSPTARRRRQRRRGRRTSHLLAAQVFPTAKKKPSIARASLRHPAGDDRDEGAGEAHPA